MIRNVFAVRWVQITLWLLSSLGAVVFILLSFRDDPETQPPDALLGDRRATIASMTAQPIEVVTLESTLPPIALPPTPLPTQAAASVTEPAAYSTPVPGIDGGSVVELPADLERAGWVSRDANGAMASSFPDYNVYAGVYQDTVYMGAVQFDLSTLDAFGPAVAAELVLFGLTGDHQRRRDGVWTLEFLADDRAFWQAPDFDALAQAPAALVLASLGPADLGPDRVVDIALPPPALDLIRALRYQGKTLTLRLRGPDLDDSLFGFDGGFGAGSRGNPPRLLISTGPAAPTSTPMVVTATPTPESVLTAAVQAMRATVQAQTTGTATPTPYNVVVLAPEEASQRQYWTDPQGTPVPIVVPTEAPTNLATAVARLKVATAIAMTTGTATPLPARYVTATPTATPVVIVATPTPENVMTLAARLVTATALAQARGTPTPLPAHAVLITPTPRFIVVTATPWPANVATAQVLRAQATVQYLLTGTPTPTPINMVTATPLPLLIPVSYFTPTPTPLPTAPLPQSLPAVLHDKILFLSDRSGETALYALDPTTGAVFSVTQAWPYTLAQERLGLAPDGKRRAIVAPDANRRLQIQLYSLEYGDTKQLTTFDATSYDPAWSPAGDRIAFVSTDPGNDEIYTVSVDGSNIQRLTFNSWEWDKHPSWSPEGQQIVFWSNRETGRRQLWIMAADGSGQRNLSHNQYNDWDPIWVH